MRKLLILAAVAALSTACHNRAEDEMGAAPDQADTTATTQVVDSTRPANATVTADSVGVDSALTNQENAGTPGATDTTSWTATPQDTLGPRDTGANDSATVYVDSASVHSDSTMIHGDSAMTGHAVPDTSGVSQ